MNLPRLNGLVWRALPPRGRSGYTTLRHYLREREHFADFRRFYEQLPDKKNIFYLFFTERLLHWALKAMQFVPADVNLVVVGSNLDPGEADWIAANVDRPFHHVPVRIDDKTLWEFLFKISRQNFGWLDIDCFVSNPQLFSEIAAIEDDVALNCIWSFIGAGGMDVMCTHFLFVNVDVLEAVKERGIRVSPCTHNYEGSNMGRGLFSFSKVPTRQQIELLKRVLPLDPKGRPVYPSSVEARFGLQCFDTLVLYQLLTNALGYRLHKVRNLNGTPETEGYYSDELVHVNAASWYVLLKTSQGIFQEHYRRMVQLNYCFLAETGDRLPSHYQVVRDGLARELDRLDIPVSQVPETVHRYFAERGFARSLAQDDAWRFLRQWRASAAPALAPAARGESEERR
jgi:hypothetical protein